MINGYCVRNWNITIRTSSLSTTKNSSWRIDIQNSLWFWDKSGSPNFGQKIWPSDSQQQQQKKKRTCSIENFGVPTDHRVKSKKAKRKKVKNRKVTVKPIVTILGNWLQDLEIRGQTETIQTTALLWQVIILRRVPGLEVTCSHSESSERPSACPGVKNHHNNKWEHIEKRILQSRKTIE